MTLYGKDNNPGTDTIATTPNIRGHAIPTGTITGFTAPVVEYIELYVSGNVAGNIRLAVYEGGTVDDPDGGTLVGEGVLVSPVTGWNRVTLDKSAITPGSNVIWAWFKTQTDPMNTVYSTVSTENEDWDNTAGLGRYQSVAVSDNPATAYPGTWPADTGTETAFWYNMRISVIETEPFILDVGGDNEFRDADTGIVIPGNNFEASQSSGKVEISDNATYGSGTVVEQTVTAWGNTSITITAVIGALAPGTPRYVWVTNDSGDRNTVGHVVHIHRAKAIGLAASANIAASGENTTFRLIAPATKTTGDFGGGRIQDDENPGDTVDIAEDEYREDEWSLEALPASLEGGVYQFRVLCEGQLLGTYTVDPRLTVSSGGTTHTVTVNDTAVVTDNASWEFDPGPHDDVVVADATGPEVGISVSDAAVVVDTLVTEADYNRPITDTAVVADTAVRNVEFERALTDSVSVADTVLVEKEIGATVNDAVAVADNASWEFDPGPHDDVVVADAIAREHDAVRDEDDTIVVVDQTSPTWSTAITEGVAVVDLLQVEVDYVRAATDAVSVVDQASWEFDPGPHDTVVVADAIAREHDAVRDEQDNIVVVDNTGPEVGISVTEAVAVADVVAREHDANRPIVDAVVVADTLVIPGTHDQEGFRFRNDDGTEITATWAASQDTNISRGKLITTRIRFILNATGDPDTRRARIQCKLASEADSEFKDIPVS